MGGTSKRKRVHMEKTAEALILYERSSPDEKHDMVRALEEDTMKGVVEVFSWYMRGDSW